MIVLLNGSKTGSLSGACQIFCSVKFIVALFVVLSTSYASAHGGKTHSEKGETFPQKIEKQPKAAAFLAKISKSYQGTIQPVFKAKCFNCHSNKTQYPWYYKIPGIKGLIDEDIREARKHMDMSKGFPFKGHGSPEDDLKALREVVRKNSMPPFRYVILHSGSSLTAEDKEKILSWIQNSLKVFKTQAP